MDEEAQEQGQGQSASSATQEHVVGLGYESCACNVTSNHVAAWHPDTGIYIPVLNACRGTKQRYLFTWKLWCFHDFHVYKIASVRLSSKGVCVCVCALAHTHTHIHIYTHIHTLEYTHACAQEQQQEQELEQEQQQQQQHEHQAVDAEGGAEDGAEEEKREEGDREKGKVEGAGPALARISSGFDQASRLQARKAEKEAARAANRGEPNVRLITCL